jgi:uncharacterized protein YrrD
MQFKEGTYVVTADGKEVGNVDRVVIDPGTKQVTHLVIRQGLLITQDKVLPIDLIDTATREQVTLKPRADNLPELPDFEETHYVTIDEDEARAGSPPAVDYASPLYWYPPLGATRWGYPAPGYPAQPSYAEPVVETETELNIPEGTVALKEGAKVYSADGEQVGNIERIFTSPNTNQATHLLISQGLILKNKKLVPMSWASTVGEDEVYLMVSSRVLDKLQEYKK